MKKKVLSILLICVMVIGLTGCGNESGKANTSNSKATVENNEGKTEKITPEELKKISDENEAKFKKYYVGAKISFDGTVSSIKVDSSMSNNSCNIGSLFERSQVGLETIEKSKNDTRNCATIEFKEGYRLLIPESGIIDIADIDQGTSLHVESNVIYMWNNQVECFGVNEDGLVDFDITTIKTK